MKCIENYCRFIIEVQGDEIIGFYRRMCNLRYGCREPGCYEVSSDTPGYYNSNNQFVTYNYRKIKIIKIGTQEQLNFLDEYYKLDYKQAIKRAIYLGFKIDVIFKDQTFE